MGGSLSPSDEPGVKALWVRRSSRGQGGVGNAEGEDWECRSGMEELGGSLPDTSSALPSREQEILIWDWGVLLRLPPWDGELSLGKGRGTPSTLIDNVSGTGPSPRGVEVAHT